MSRSCVQGNSRLLIQQALDRTARGAFTPGGDLSGTGQDQVVDFIQGMPMPPGSSANLGDILRVEALLETPRCVILDGSTLWLGESDQSPGGGSGTRFVTAMNVSDPWNLQVTQRVELPTDVPNMDRVRDLAQDDTYIYAACWDAMHVAIINKRTGEIAGWAYAPDPNGTRVLSVATDGDGKLFAMVLADWGGVGVPYVARWDIASCIGQNPATVAPEATCPLPNPARHVRYGSGSVYVFDANFGTGIFRLDPVAMTIAATYVQPPGHCYMTGIVAFGSLWAVDLYGPLLRMDPTTLAIQSSIVLPGAGNPGPIGIDFGPDGSGGTGFMWVSDSFTPICWSIDPSTDVPTSYALPAAYTEGVVGNDSNVFLGAYVGLTPTTPGIVVLDPSVPLATVQNPLGLVYQNVAYGQLYNTTLALGPIAPAGEHDLFYLNTAGPASLNVTPNTVNDNFTVADSGLYDVNYSYEIAPGVVPNDLSIGIAVNGTLVDQGKSREHFTTTDRKMLGASAQLLLNAGDVVSLRYTITVASGVTSQYNTFSIKRIG